MTAAQLRALRFVAEHPGGTAHRAYPFGYSWHFDAPELKRPPCRKETLHRLLDQGMIAIKANQVLVTPRGLKELGRAVHP